MSNFNLGVQHRTDHGPLLETILDCVKSLHCTLSALMADVAAMRRTVLDDPISIEIYREHLRQTMATTKPLVEEAMVSYDALLEEILKFQQSAN